MPTRLLSALVAALSLVLVTAASASALLLKQNETDDWGISSYCDMIGGTGTAATYLRRFDLADTYGVDDPFRLSSVTFGVALADGGTQTVYVRIYATPAGDVDMLYRRMTLIKEVPVTVDDADEGHILTAPVDAVLAYPDDHDLVVAVADEGENGKRFVLMQNQGGESASSYVSMTCNGAVQPTPPDWRDYPQLTHVLWAEGEPDPSEQVFANQGPPAIEGTPRVGQPITVRGGAWTPEPTGRSYQWYFNGFLIPGATGPTFTPQPNHLGTRLTVVETVSRTGHHPRSRGSAQSERVANGVFTNSSVPTISGTPRVGETLTAAGGTWSPTPQGRSYRWYVGGTLVNGATGPTFVPRPEDVGKTVHVVERVTATAYDAAEEPSATVGPVLPGIITNTVLPVISGGTRVLDTLSVSPGTWVPPDADLAYQWLVDGDEVMGATDSAYELRVADLGGSVSVRVTASKPGYDPATVEAAAVGPVQRCMFALDRAPTVLGDVAVGETIEAIAGGWHPVPGTVGYQWLADGDAIAGATASSYTPRPGDLGKRVSVRVDVAHDGCVADAATSAPTDPVAAGKMRVITRPALESHPALDEPVTVSHGEWDVDPTAVTYQWLRAGEPIPGATSATYVPAPADVGTWLSVVVTVSAPGYEPREITTAAAFPVSPVVSENLERPAITGTPTAGETLTVDPGEWSFEPEDLAYQWYAGARRIGGAAGVELVLDDPELVGEAISVKVTASSEVQPPVSATSAPTSPVRKASPQLDVELSTTTPQVRETRVRVDVAVTAPGTLPVEGDLRVLVDGRVVARETAGDGSVRVTLPVFRSTGRHRVVVRYGGSALLLADSSRSVVRVQR